VLRAHVLSQKSRLLIDIAKFLDDRPIFVDDHPSWVASDLGGESIHPKEQLQQFADQITSLGAAFCHGWENPSQDTNEQKRRRGAPPPTGS
jgi:hypothetical protein